MLIDNLTKVPIDFMISVLGARIQVNGDPVYVLKMEASYDGSDYDFLMAGAKINYEYNHPTLYGYYELIMSMREVIYNHPYISLNDIIHSIHS